MLLRYGILCIFVSAILLFLVSKTYKTLTSPDEVPSEKEVATKSVTRIEAPKIIEEKRESSTLSSHVAISEKNIFNPERRDFPTQSGPEGKKPLVRPQIILYGVTVAGDYQSACIGNSGSPVKKGERVAMTLKIGDPIGEYRLARILPDRITLEAMEDSFDILLYDPSKPKQRIHAKAETKPAAITSVVPTSPVSSTTSPTSSQIIPSQEAPKPKESTGERTTQTKVPKLIPPTLNPSTERSRRAPLGSQAPSPSTPIGPPGALTEPRNP
jgi:hypothetical protein